MENYLLQQVKEKYIVKLILEYAADVKCNDCDNICNDKNIICIVCNLVVCNNCKVYCDYCDENHCLVCDEDKLCRCECCYDYFCIHSFSTHTYKDYIVCNFCLNDDEKLELL